MQFSGSIMQERPGTTKNASSVQKSNKLYICQMCGCQVLLTISPKLTLTNQITTEKNGIPLNEFLMLQFNGNP